MFLIQYLRPQKRLNVNSIKMIFIAHEYCNRFVRKMLVLVLLKKKFSISSHIESNKIS